jgi:ABC-type nitrate/sulfonate/bicarbonate transport system substrate-binding protein
MGEVRFPQQILPLLTVPVWLLAAGCSGDSRNQAPRSLEGVTLKCDGPHGTRFLGFYMARAMGFYGDEGLEVAVEDSSQGSEPDIIPIRVAAGEYDFAVGSEALVQAQQAGLPLVALSRIEQHGFQALYTRRGHVEERRDLVEKFVRASLRGWRWAVENPEEAVDEMLSSYPELVDRRKYWQISFESAIPLISTPGTPVGSLDCPSWGRHIQIEGSAGVDLCDNSFFLQSVKAGGGEGRP